MHHIFFIPQRLLNQIKDDPYFGARFLSFIIVNSILLMLIDLYLSNYGYSISSQDFPFISFMLVSLAIFITSYFFACICKYFINRHISKKTFNSTCTAFISTLFFVYSLDNKMKLDFKKQILVFEIDETKLSAQNRHKYKEYQILTKYLSSQLFYKGFPDFEHALTLQWRYQCIRFASNDGDLSAHWIQSVNELKEILIPHKAAILEISKDIEKYKAEKKQGATAILEKIKQSFAH